MKEKTIMSDDITLKEIKKFFALFKSQREAARALGISAGYGCYLLHGYHRPSVQVAYRMMELADGQLKLSNLLRPKKS